MLVYLRYKRPQVYLPRRLGDAACVFPKILPSISILALASGLLNASPQPGFVPAECDESRIKVVVNVDGSNPSASDEEAPGRGKADRPFKSILAAGARVIALLGEGKPTKLLIAPGVYREDLTTFMRLKHESDAVRKTPLVIEGAGKGAVILKGSVEAGDGADYHASNWKLVPGSSNIYSHEWKPRWGVNPGPWADRSGMPTLGVAARREAIFLDGRPLLQMEAERFAWVDPDGAAEKTLADPHQARKSNNPGRMVYKETRPLDVLDGPWKFAVYERDAIPELKGRIFVRLPEGMTMKSFQAIEVSVQPTGDQPLFRIAFKENLILRNLTIQHANPGFNAGALWLLGCRNVLIEDCQFTMNTGTGLQVDDGQQVTVRRCVANDNGHKGMGFTGSGLLIEDCDTSFNNERGARSGFLGWAAAGVKILSQDVIIRRHVAVGNHTGGIWFDMGNANVLVESSFLYGNERPGLEFEFSSKDAGGFVARDNVMAKNLTCGLFISDVRDVDVSGNLIYGNSLGKLENEMISAQIVFKNYIPRGPDTPEQWMKVGLVDNLIAATGNNKMIASLKSKTTPEGYTDILKIVKAARNTYLQPDLPAGFILPDGSVVDLAGWTSFLASLGVESPEAGSTSASDSIADFTIAPDSPMEKKIQALGIPIPYDHLRRLDSAEGLSDKKEDRTDG